MTTSEAGESWLNILASTHTAPETLRKYRRLVKLLSSDLRDLQLATIKLSDLQSYSSRRKLSANSANRETQILKSFFSFCLSQGWLMTNPAERLRAPRYNPPARLPYSPDEIAMILAACERVGQNSYERSRARAAILLMRYTGLRISDALLLRKDAVQSGILTLRTQKTKAPVAHDLNLFPDLLFALEALPVPIGSRAHGHFFWNGTGNPRTLLSDMHRLLRRVYILSGVALAHNHRFRHSWASDMLSTGKASLWLVAKQLGITTAICEKVYGHMTADFHRQVREATMQAFFNKPSTGLAESHAF